MTDTPQPLLKYGLSQQASDALRYIGITAERTGQTIGSAAASAGTHEQDGIDPHGHPYSSAVDLRVKDLGPANVKTWLDRLGSVGFAAWYRVPGYDHWPADQPLHVHAVWSGLPCKELLRHQIHDFCAGKNGLASHVAYAFHPPNKQSINKVRELFLASGNPVTG